MSRNATDRMREYYESQLGGGNLFEEKCICTIICVTTSLLLSIFFIGCDTPMSHEPENHRCNNIHSYYQI